MTTLYQAFQTATRSFTDRVALIPVDESAPTLNYNELAHLVAELAAHIRQNCPFQPGDRVGLMLSNHPEFVTAFFALQSLGAVVIPLSYRLSAPELEVILQDSGMCVLISSREFDSIYSPVQSQLHWLVLTEATDDPTWLTADIPAFSIADWLAEDTTPLLPEPVSLESSDLAVLIYTSGTTGRPKGVMLSHENLLADAKANAAVIEATAEDRFVTCSPLFHVFGLTNVLLTALIQGASIVLVPRFHPKVILEAISHHQVTFLAAVPTMYQMMLSLLPDPRFNLDSLRVCHSGAAPMPKAVFEQVESLFQAPVQEGYGQSEASSIMTSNPLHGDRKPGSIGKAIPGLLVEIVDDTDQVMPPFEVGELRARGPTVMQGYWNRPEATRQTLRNGWLYTSDLGFTDEDGYIFLMGRKDDRINVGGIKVYPQEVEDVIYRHPYVAACAVTGETSDLYHQIVAVYVVLKSGCTLSLEELHTFCQPQLAAHKIPKALYVVDEIPKGPTGKILRYQLKPGSGVCP